MNSLFEITGEEIARLGEADFKKKDGEKLEWCELALKFLERSRDTSAMLNVFMERLYPNSWSGSLADTLTNRAELLEALPVKEDYRSQLSEKIKELRKLAEKSV